MEEFLRATDLIERCGWPRWPHSWSDGGISYAWRMMFGWNRRRMHPGIIRSGKLGTADPRIHCGGLIGRGKLTNQGNGERVEERLRKRVRRRSHCGAITSWPLRYWYDPSVSLSGHCSAEWNRPLPSPLRIYRSVRMRQPSISHLYSKTTTCPYHTFLIPLFSPTPLLSSHLSS